MTSRREFLTITGAGLCSAAEHKFSRPLGLQIYSLRREAAKDLPKTLELIQKLGFTELEIGGFYSRTPQEFRRMLDQNDLNATSMGAAWQQLSTSLGEVADSAGVMGVEY